MNTYIELKHESSLKARKDRIQFDYENNNNRQNNIIKNRTTKNRVYINTEKSANVCMIEQHNNII